MSSTSGGLTSVGAFNTGFNPKSAVKAGDLARGDMPEMNYYMAQGSGTNSSPAVDHNMNYAMPLGGAESSIMDSGPYSPKQSGLLNAIEVQPDIENAKALAERFEASKVGGYRVHNRVKTAPQTAGRRLIN